jgi:hypothetical protein
VQSSPCIERLMPRGATSVRGLPRHSVGRQCRLEGSAVALRRVAWFPRQMLIAVGTRPPFSSPSSSPSETRSERDALAFGLVQFPIYCQRPRRTTGTAFAFSVSPSRVHRERGVLRLGRRRGLLHRTGCP